MSDQDSQGNQGPNLAQVTESLNKIMAQLDQLNLTQSSLSDLRNPLLQSLLTQTRSAAVLQPIKHTSYYSHMSHYSSLAT